MRFLFPLGLLALLGIPLVIIIYIIKNKYTEQTIASTYLWELSERFLKRKVPISKLAGIISLILQLVAIVLIALAASHPVLILKNSANDYCFVLDASGSMNIEYSEGSTRFDEGKERIKRVIRNSTDGSTYTLIYAGGSVENIYERLTDKDRAVSLLEDLSVSFEAADLEPAIESAQEFYDSSDAALAFVATDKTVEKSDNITLINVGGERENVALSDVTYELTDVSLTVRGFAMSYSSDKSVVVDLYIDDGEVPAASEELSLVKGERGAFELTVEATAEILEFGKLRVALQGKDSLALDDEVIIYNQTVENEANILLVSDAPFFISAALMSSGYMQITTVATEEYEPNTTGYGLYIFESYLPDKLPTDGSVWIFNPKKSVTGAGFSFQSEIEAAQSAKYSTSTASMVKKLLSGVNLTQFGLYKYSKLGLSGSFYTLATCDGNPMIFVGDNSFGNREAVFSFDLKDSTPFLFSSDYTTLIGNLLSYSFPTAIDGAAFFCGDTLQINKIAGCESIRVLSPLGTVKRLDASSAIVDYVFKEAGSYKIELTMKDKSVKTFNLFVSMPYEECDPLSAEQDISLVGEGKGKSDGHFDHLWIIFVILAVVAAADFGVYCYEQYQLR